MDNDDRIAYLSGDIEAPLDPAERAALDELRGVLRDPAVWAEPDPSLEDRVVAAIADARVDEPVAPLADVSRRRPRWVPYTILGAAAAVLLAIGITIGLTHDRSHPLQYAASVDGTKLAPSASGDVTLTKTKSGWKIELHADGLPRRDNGDYYEAWLKNSAGVLVPIGTFNEGHDVTLWSGVPPTAFPTITVTRQLANGRESSSGQVVLIGATHRKH
jgi:hypothetical protein